MGISLFSPTLAAICLLLGLSLWLFSGRWFNPQLKLLNLLWLLQMLWVGAASYWLHPTDTPTPSLLKDLLRDYLLWFWFSGSLYWLPRRVIRRSLLLFIGLSSVCSLIVIGQVWGWLPLKCDLWPSLECISTRDVGFHHPYTTSGIFLVSFFLSIPLMESVLRLSQRRRLLKIALGLLVLLPLLGILVIGQRACVLGLLGGVLLWALLRFRRNLWHFAGTLLTLLLFSVGAYVSSGRLRNRVLRLLNFQEDHSSVGCRLALWQENWRAFQENLWLGQGSAVEYACFRQLLGHAHNIYLQQLVVGGLLGFALWLAFPLTALWRMIRARPWQHYAYTAGVCALAIEGLFENWYGDSEVYSAFLLLLSLGLAAQSTQSGERRFS